MYLDIPICTSFLPGSSGKAIRVSKNYFPTRIGKNVIFVNELYHIRFSGYNEGCSWFGRDDILLMIVIIPSQMNFINLYKPEQGTSIWEKKVPAKLALAIILIAAAAVFWLTKKMDSLPDFHFESPVVVFHRIEKEIIPEKKKEEWHFDPQPFTMDQVKKNGCVADGFLSDYGGKSGDIADMIDRSNCIYLHRALETWLKPPSFNQAEEIMQKVKKRPVIYGMFLAEALSTRRSYSDPDWDHDFKFDKMCREGTEDRWETDSCIPSIEKPEYQRYLKSITHRAMDLGIQSFMFGQIELQDEHPSYDQTQVRTVLDDMRAYAKKKKMQIIIGAQTNDITDEGYLRLFDYVEGGVGIDSHGNVEDQPCSSKFSSCWALLWDKAYSAKANNVLLHLDWSGLTWDDMGIFTKMSQDERVATLQKLYQKFTSQDMGFMMPFLAVINHENGGCYAPNKNFYTPSKKYRCDDENAINKMMPSVAKVDAKP